LDRVTCPKCGNEHDLSESEVGFSLPDVVYAMDEPTRTKRAVCSVDLCAVDGARYFVRGVLYLPVRGRDEPFGWGVWAEISREAFNRCVERWEDPQQGSEPPFEGRLANRLPEYTDTVGLVVDAQLTGLKTRPVFALRDSDHALAVDQRDGIDLVRVLELVSPYIH
jgi:hypothetical protein